MTFSSDRRFRILSVLVFINFADQFYIFHWIRCSTVDSYSS